MVDYQLSVPYFSGKQSRCSRLEQLNLQSCEGVTQSGVVVALEQLQQLRRLEYQQKFSLLEILIKWSDTSSGERAGRVFQLRDVKHVFPYGLIILQNHMTSLAQLLPQLTSLTLVTLDTTAAQLAQFPQLRRITLELEDCLGPGTLQLLTQLGPQLLEVSISCSSDPDTPLTLDQTAGPAGQQGQLFNAAVLAVGELCPAVTKLSVSVRLWPGQHGGGGQAQDRGEVIQPQAAAETSCSLVLRSDLFHSYVL